MKKFCMLLVLPILLSGCYQLDNPEYCGTFKGVLPAASGPGIETTVALNRNHTFSTHLIYIDEEDGTFDETGKFTVDDNIVEIKPSNDEISYYRVEGNRLRRLDSNQKPITGDLANYYILKKIKNCQ